MNLKKAALSMLSMAILAGCSTSNVTNEPVVNSEVNFKSTMTPGTVINQEKNEVFLADLGNGKKGATMTVTINFPESAFTTKASAHGNTRGLASNITGIRLGLTNDASDPGANLLLGSGTMMTTVSLLPTAAGTKSYTFTNVPPGTGYYATVKFFGQSGQTENLMSPTTHTTTGNWAVSTTSRDVVLNSTTGAYEVQSGGTADLTSMTINVQLRDEVGAQLGTDVVVTDGAAMSGTVGVTSP